MKATICSKNIPRDIIHALKRVKVVHNAIIQDLAHEIKKSQVVEGKRHVLVAEQQHARNTWKTM